MENKTPESRITAVRWVFTALLFFLCVTLIFNSSMFTDPRHAIFFMTGGFILAWLLGWWLKRKTGSI